MEKLADIMKVIEKLNLKQLLLSLGITLFFVFVPPFNFLESIIPLDSKTVWVFVFAILICYFFIETIRKVCKFIHKQVSNCRKKKERLDELQENISILPCCDKKLLKEYLDNENKPKKVNNIQQLNRLGGGLGLCLLDCLESRQRDQSCAGLFNKINIKSYKDLRQLYKAKKI